MALTVCVLVSVSVSVLVLVPATSTAATAKGHITSLPEHTRVCATQWLRTVCIILAYSAAVYACKLCGVDGLVSRSTRCKCCKEQWVSTRHFGLVVIQAGFSLQFSLAYSSLSSWLSGCCSNGCWAPIRGSCRPILGCRAICWVSVFVSGTVPGPSPDEVQVLHLVCTCSVWLGLHIWHATHLCHAHHACRCWMLPITWITAPILDWRFHSLVL